MLTSGAESMSIRRRAGHPRPKDGDPAFGYAVVIGRNNLLGDRSEVRDPQEIAKRGPRGGAVAVRRAAFAGNVVNVDGAKVDAPAHHIRGVRHGRVQLRSGENNDPARGDDEAYFRLEFQRLLGVRLDAGIVAYVLRGILTALGIPSVVIEVARSILDTAAPVTRMERHAILGDEFVDRRPPIELAHRRRIPGIAMRVVGVCDPCREIVFWKSAAQTGHVLIGLVTRA